MFPFQLCLAIYKIKRGVFNCALHFIKGDSFCNELEVYKIIETFRFCIGLIVTF